MFINMNLAPYINIVEKDIETILWENSAPTTAFADQIVTLSDSIENYDEILVEYAYSTSNSKKQKETIDVSDFLLTTTTTGDFVFSVGSGINNYAYVRSFWYDSNNSIHISNAYQIGNVNADNSMTIPIKIIGIKKATSTGGKQVKTGFLSSIPSDGFINCGFDPKHVTVVSKYNGNNTNAFVYDEDDSTTNYRQYYSNSTVQNESVAIGTTDRAGFLSVGNGTNGFTLNYSYISYFTNVRYIATD